jgi:hypothetical protein
MQREELLLPMVLDRRQETLRLAENSPQGEIVDTVVTFSHPVLRREEGRVVMEIPGAFQVLSKDAEGNLRGEVVKTQAAWELPAHESSQVWAAGAPGGWAKAAGSALGAEVCITATTLAGDGIPMVASLRLGEVEEPDPDRPSLILRRAGQASLWELAKCCGSTMEAICGANGLSGEPEQDAMLLIPVI